MRTNHLRLREAVSWSPVEGFWGSLCSSEAVWVPPFFLSTSEIRSCLLPFSWFLLADRISWRYGANDRWRHLHLFAVQFYPNLENFEQYCLLSGEEIISINSSSSVSESSPLIALSTVSLLHSTSINVSLVNAAAMSTSDLIWRHRSTFSAVLMSLVCF